MKILKRISISEWITMGFAFIYYWVMGLYKLTQAPIWQDEAMEYYCSIPVKGAIRGVTEYATMYERMAYIQQQPPLYNWMMCIWLQIHDSEWWFRFSSVVLGFIASVALYLIIRKISNFRLAAISVVVYSSIYIVMYYLKEASEYALLIMILMWGIYLFLCMVDAVTVKKIWLFILFGVLAVFTQYGAVFVVVPMGILILLLLYQRKEWKYLKLSCILDLSAGIIGGGALVYFYLFPQTTNSVSTLFSAKEIIIEKGSIFGDFLNSIMCVFRWCSIDMDRDWEKIGILICMAIVILVFIAIYVLIKSNNTYYKALFYLNAITYIIYYVITKLNFYAYGWYGNRYNMFLLPIWLVMTIFSLYEFCNLLMNSKHKLINKSSKVVKIGIILITVLYCCYGDYRISNHWAKMDLRTVVAQWYEHKGYETPTLLDYHQRYGFVYYFTHNPAYKEEQWNHIVSNETVETYDVDDTNTWIDYLNEVYEEDIPREMYVVTGQWNSLVDTFVELGYDIEPIVDINAKLYYVHRK